MRFRLGFLLKHGGSKGHRLRSTGRACSCSAPAEYSYEDGGYVKVGLKGQSCIHVVGTLIGEMKRAGLTYDQARTLLMDRSNIGAVWLQTRPEPMELLRDFWHGSKEKSVARRPRRSWTKPGTFVFHWGKIDDVLMFVANNPNVSTTEIRQHFANKWRGGGRVAQSYVEHCRDMGFLQATRRGRRIEHVAVAWPVLPQRKNPWEHLTDYQIAMWARKYPMPTEEEFGPWWRTEGKNGKPCLQEALVAWPAAFRIDRAWNKRQREERSRRWERWIKWKAELKYEAEQRALGNPDYMLKPAAPLKRVEFTQENKVVFASAYSVAA